MVKFQKLKQQQYIKKKSVHAVKECPRMGWAAPSYTYMVQQTQQWEVEVDFMSWIRSDDRYPSHVCALKRPSSLGGSKPSIAQLALQVQKSAFPVISVLYLDG